MGRPANKAVSFAAAAAPPSLGMTTSRIQVLQPQAVDINSIIIGHGIPRVQAQIHEHLFELRGIGFDSMFHQVAVPRLGLVQRFLRAFSIRDVYRNY